MSQPALALRSALVLVALGLTAACGGAAHSGVVSGPADAHCNGVTPPVVGACQLGTATMLRAGMQRDADAGTDEVSTPRYGSEADDDDCKYHVKWTASSVAVNTDVSFTVTLLSKPGLGFVSGADPYIEAYLSDTHPAPNSASKTTSPSPGVYTIGPARFDAKGQWVVKFHFFHTCEDVSDASGNASPHGHAAFFVQVS